MKKTDTNRVIKTVIVAATVLLITQIVGLWLLACYVSQTAAGIHEGIHTLRTESQ